uniref:RAB11 family interacting protein 5a (class I) n=1 Tax=Cyprinus carpio TaxID=7962 RepID=A0A8C1RXN2_CYPCA
MSLVKSDEEQRWVPTHVQVTVLRARGLRAKGKHGTSDVYTIIQLGKEKYSTCVMEKTTDPEWGEECAFELQPGILEEGGRDAYPPGAGDLTLTVMHRALIGLDVFLGQAVIPLDEAFQERKYMKNEWCRLHSKTGKKEKERGELQLTVQFTRHNLTASMYDLSMKDKPRSAFDKLRERMRAKKRSSEEDSSSAIVPGGYGALARMRGRLPSDGGGEEDYEDDEGGEVRRSKMRNFFLRGKLRKSSDTRSSTSLCSESSESSSRGGSLSPTAGISVVVSDLSNSPSNSSNLTADNSPEHTVAPSPQVSPVRHVMYDISLPVPHSLTSEYDTPILLPSVWVNGNPVEMSPLTHHPPSLVLQQPQPESTKPVTQSGQPRSTTLPAEPQKTQSAQPKSQETQLPKSQSKPRPEPLLPALGVLQKGSLSLSLQNLSHRGEDKLSSSPVDGRRWSFDKPGEEEKAAIVAALEQAGRLTDEVEMETVIPAGETETLSKKRRGLFSHGKGDSAGKGPIASKEEAERAQPLVEVKHKGWFSSKDSHSKPSPSPQSGSSASTICPIVPLTFNDPSQSMADKNTNPFTSSPPLFDANPFLPHTQQNPFIQELHSAAPLTPDVPSLFSSTHSQSDGNATPDLPSTGNQKGPSQMDISFDPLISFKVPTEQDDFEHFANDRLKSEEVNETMNLVTPPALFTKTNNQEPSGALGGLTVSDTNYPTDLGRTASASAVETCKETASDTPVVSVIDVNYICSSSNKPDLTAHGELVFPEFDLNSSEISLPENSNLGFSELNTLACPYPALSPHSKNEDTSLEDHPKTKQNVSQPSVSKADTVKRPSSISFEFSEGVSVSPETSQRPEMLEFAKDIESGTVNEDPMPFCGDNSSGDTLEHSTVISDSLGGDVDHQSIEHRLSPQSDIIQSNITQSNEEFWGSNASLIQNVAVSGKSLVEATEPLVFHVQSGQSSLVSTALPVKNGGKTDAVMDTILQNESGNGILEGVSSKDICSEIEDFVPENLNDGPSFPVLSKPMSYDMQEDKQEKVNELPTSPFKKDNMVSQLSTISEEEEIMPSNEPTLPVGHLHPTTGIRTGTEEGASDPNSVLSPGSVLLHSMYKSADSDHYLTCVSQEDFPVSPNLELTKRVKPRHDLSEEDTSEFESLPNHIPNVVQQDDISAKRIPEKGCKQDEVIAENINPFPEALPKQESPLQVLQNNSLLDLLPGMHTYSPKSAPSHNTSSENMIKSDFDEAVLKCNPSGDIVEKSNFPKAMSPIVVTSEMIAELEAQLAPLDTDTCLVDESKTCPKDGSFNMEPFGIVSENNLHLVQLTDSNAFVSNCSSEQTSSITQDLVITDSDLKNIFVPQPTEMHLLSTSKGLVANPESADTHNDPEPNAKQTDSLDINIDFWTTPAVRHSVTPDLFPVNWPTLSQPSASSPFDQPTLASRHDHSLNFTSSLFDLSPVASSTPHVAVDTNALPQLFPFSTIPRTSEVPRPKPAAPLPTMQAVNSTAFNPFLQDKTQTSDHQSSPHPVKPLTPPDEKRSEGRSVLEKLKSTIHSGRTGQDADKKLVEGGGTYYHLNHSELVNLLIQRDTELRQEREEYERRGALLEKRETELKKMKVLIKDLEDYIDTLLVRIMEQTPTLLQVRSKMK